MSEILVTAPTIEGAHAAHGTQASAGQNPWLSYFGPPSGPIVTNAYDKYAEQTYDLPEAYRGKNLFLRDTVDGLITDGSKPQWYTSVCLPWAQTDQITFSWNEFHFNETLAGRVPHEGVSRLVTSSRQSRQDKSVRRGLAMLLEHGFMSTPEGQNQYRMNLQGIAQCVQETANHDVMGALLTCDNYDKRWERDHGIIRDGTRQMLQNEVYNFAVVQKTPHGLDILVEEAKKRMGRYGAKPDLMIIPPKLAIYLTLVRPEKTQYYIAGPDGSKNIREGPDAMANFRGLNVFETRSFDVYEGEPPVDLCMRRRQVGEYYTNAAAAAVIAPSGSSKYTMDNEAVVIYNEDVDNWSKISFEDMVDNCHHFKFDVDRDDGHDDYTKPMIEEMLKEPQLAKQNAEYAQFKFDSEPVQHAIKIPNGKTFMENSRRLEPPNDLMFSRFGTDGTNDVYFLRCRRIGHIHAKYLNPVIKELEKLSNQKYFQSRGGAFGGGDGGSGSDEADDESVDSVFHELYSIASASPALRDAFSPGSQGSIDTAIGIVSDSGYTGHPALHCSWRGVQLIAQEGCDEHKKLAHKLISRVNDQVQKLKHLNVDNLDAMYKFRLAPNYQYSLDGTRLISAVKGHYFKTFIFNRIFNVPCQHSLSPVLPDGTSTALAKLLPGDTVLCPAFAIKRFLDTSNGVVGNLSISNCALGIIGDGPKTIPKSVQDPVWQENASEINSMSKFLHMQTIAESNVQRYQPRKRTVTGISTAIGGSKRSRFSRQERVPTQAVSVAAAPTQNTANNFSMVDNLMEDYSSFSRNSDIGKLYPIPKFNNDETYETARHINDAWARYDFQGASGQDLDLSDAYLSDYLSINLDKHLPRNLKERPPPFCFLLCRPFIDHQMYTLILMKGGQDTGATYYGHNSVTVGDDAVSKMHYCNFTFYQKALVRSCKNVFRAEDAYAAGYVGGNGTKFFNTAEDVSACDTADPDCPSIMAFVVSREEVTQLPNPLNILGNFEGVLKDPNSNSKHFSTAPYYRKHLKLDMIGQYDPKMMQENPVFTSDSKEYNTTCFQGAQINFNPAVDQFNIETVNTGHWGHTYPGVRSVREGQNKFMEAQVSSKTPFAYSGGIAPVR